MSSGKTYSFSGLRAEPWTNRNVSLDVVPRQLAEEIPAPLPHGGRAGAVLQLVPRPEDRPLGPRIEPLGIEQGALVVVAQQADLALHHHIDHFARIRAVADHVAETVDLGHSLARMSASTASRASRLLWISLMRARFTLVDFQPPAHGPYKKRRRPTPM